MLKPKIYPVCDFDIPRHYIDPYAIIILDKLHKSGFVAYLVGGSVRDLLMKQKPKDFDISTSAKPEEIKKLFKGSILIGRRFRLAHIRFKKKIFEVSTFRTGDINHSKLIIRDNKWGSPEQDVLRRDFTMNGLFYDHLNDTIIDYVGGYEDLYKKMLQTIGKPIIRFKQDPVRMIRLLKFQARFNFSIDKKTLDALTECKDEISKSSPARILEELLRMLESGAAQPFFHLMLNHGFLELLFPWLDSFMKNAYKDDIYHYLNALDKFNDKNPPSIASRSVLFASLIFPILEREIQKRFPKNSKILIENIDTLVTDLLNGMMASSFHHVPKRMLLMLNYILKTQYRLTPLSNYNAPKSIAHHKDFRRALQFLNIRYLVNPSLVQIHDYWKKQMKTCFKTKKRHL